VCDVVAKDTGELIFTTRTGQDRNGQNRLRFFAKLGADRVPLTQQEVKEIKQKSNILQKSNGLVLWGFKKHASSFHYTLEPSYFVYPNDERVKGSTKAFANLHAAMLRKGVVGYGELLTRVTAIPRLVEILAMPEVREQIEVDDDIGSGEAVLEERQVSPPGFTLFILPFQDDVRSIAPDKASEAVEQMDDVASDEVKSAATDLIRGLKLEDVELGERFENAALNEFWNYVEKIALNLPVNVAATSKHQYDTQINDNEILKNVGAKIESFKLALPEDDIATSGSRKRKPVIDKSDIVAYIESLHRKSQLEKATIAELQEFLGKADVEIPVKSKKADLIRVVVRYFEGLDGGFVAVKVEEQKDDDHNGEGGVVQMYRTGQLAKCSVAQLKEHLENVGERVKGRVKKDDLLKRVKELFCENESGLIAIKKEENESGLIAIKEEETDTI
jgi:hypothetical protein